MINFGVNYCLLSLFKTLLYFDNTIFVTSYFFFYGNDRRNERTQVNCILHLYSY